MTRTALYGRRSRALGLLAATALTFTAACGGDDADEPGDDETATAQTSEAPEPTEEPVAFGETATLPNGLSITPSELTETDDEPDLNFPEDTEGPYFVFEIEFTNAGDDEVDLKTLKFQPQPDNGRGIVHIDLTGMTNGLGSGETFTAPAALHSLEDSDSIELLISDADGEGTVAFRD